MTRTGKGTRGPWSNADLCQHQPTGTVAWPTDGRDGHRASVYCCNRSGCITKSARWVLSCTGHLGVYRELNQAERPKSHLTEHNVAQKSQAKARIEQAAAWKSEGVTLEEIGRRLGCSRQRAHQLLSRAR